MNASMLGMSRVHCNTLMRSVSTRFVSSSLIHSASWTPEENDAPGPCFAIRLDLAREAVLGRRRLLHQHHWHGGGADFFLSQKTRGGGGERWFGAHVFPEGVLTLVEWRW